MSQQMTYEENNKIQESLSLILPKQNNNLLYLIKQIPKEQSKESKLETLRQIKQIIDRYGEIGDEQNLTDELCKELLVLLCEDQTELQNIIMQIMRDITRNGSNLVYRREKNVFFDLFLNSGLINKIIIILIRQIANDQNEKKQFNYSEMSIHLTQIIFFIYKSTKLGSSILLICGEIIVQQISLLINNISIQDKNEIDSKQQMNNANLLNEIQEGIQMLESVRCLAEDFVNRDYLIENFKIHEVIAPLIHLNCPTELYCSKQISMIQSDLISELIGAAFGVLGELSCIHTVNQYLQNNHNAFGHIFPFIISFSNIHLNRSQSMNIKESQSIISYSQYQFQPQQIIIGSILLILYYIFNSNSQLLQNNSYLYNFIDSLKFLTQFNKSTIMNKQNQNKSALIREYSFWCLHQIWNNNSDEIKQILIIKYKLSQILIQCIGIIGGSKESNSQVIINALLIFRSVFNNFNSQINYQQQTQLQLNVSNKEIIEEEGGNEEIDSHIYHSKQLNDRVCYWTKILRELINNTKKHYSI